MAMRDVFRILQVGVKRSVDLETNGSSRLFFEISFVAFQAFSRSTTCIRSQREPLDSHESMRPFARLWSTQLAVPCGVEAVRCVCELCHNLPPSYMPHIPYRHTHTYIYIYNVYLLYNICMKSYNFSHSRS